MSFAKESRDLLIECCVEFITMISSEANEIAEKDAKKTIACEHITKALEELGFSEYVPDLLEVAQQFKTQQVVRNRPHGRHNQLGTDPSPVEGKEAEQDRTERTIRSGVITPARRAVQIGYREIQCWMRRY